MNATIQKQDKIDHITKITVTLRNGQQFEITEGRNGLIVRAGTVTVARRYDGLAWEIEAE